MGSDSFDLVLAVFREPARIAEIRERPLPEDVARVIRLAAGEASALEDAVRSTGENEKSSSRPRFSFSSRSCLPRARIPIESLAPHRTASKIACVKTIAG